MRIRRVLSLVGALALTASMVGGASGAQREREEPSKKQRTFEREVNDPLDQHGPEEGHMPATKANVGLVGRLRLTRTPGGISDVHVFRNYAYLGAWARECRFDAEGNAVDGGGVHVVNISDPRAPRKVAFIDAGPNNYYTEGIHALRMNTRFFTGDVLVLSNEACDSSQPHRGGIDLYDITDPRHPVALSLGQGDQVPEDPDAPVPDSANLAHSAMGWQAGGRAFAVLVDNEELADIDIMEITDPYLPELIAETGLDDWPDAQTPLANGDNPFHHDMWVKRIGGHYFLMASYWDAGWVQLNVDDPANPTFVDDFDYADTDPIFGVSPPEGNAHQGEWTRDGRFFVGTDEDFSPTRFETFEITTGASAGPYGAGEFGWTVPIPTKYEDSQINGPTVYGGSGCEDDADGDGTSDREETLADAPASVLDQVIQPGEERIIAFSRGVCFFSTKVETGQLAGYDVVIIGNSHAGSGSGASPDGFICGGQGHEFEITASGVCVGHRALHVLFDDAPEYTPTEAGGCAPGCDLPPIGTIGESVAGSSAHDGWGYVHLINAATLNEVDAYAPAELGDPEFGFGRGALTVHEVETDPRRGVPLVYASWYSMGFRVLRYTSSSLTEVGRFIAQGGNDFWGVAVINRGRNHRPLLALSDRDFGLFIFRYRGQE